MIVVKQLEQRVHIASFGLEFLWHGRQDNFALVNRGEVACGFARAEHLGDSRAWAMCVCAWLLNPPIPDLA